jgi:UDP-glucose 4-epimerase
LASRACGPGRFEFYEQDINDENLYKLFEGVDTVFLLAALAKVQYSTDYPVESNHANIDGTLNVLESARKAGVRRVVFSSSSSVYGGATEFPTPETAPLSPKSNYALQKLCGEQYCRMYGVLYGLDTVCLRYHNVFGIGSRLGGAYSALLPTIMNAAVNGGALTINGDGGIERDYTPVSCVVQANILAATHSGWVGGEAFNVALGETYSINYVYDAVCKLSGRQINKVHGPTKREDPLKSLADITKARIVLGYNPNKTFDSCLSETYLWWAGGCKCQG